MMVWFKTTFSALGFPKYRLYWLSQMVSLVGMWLQATAMSYLVLEMTGSSTALGWVYVAQFAPTLLFSLLAGAILDRFPKQRILQITQGVMLLGSLVLGIWVHSGQVNLTVLLIMAFINGTANAFNIPARQALTADFVPKTHLSNAIALNSFSFNTSRAIGQALFGFIVPLGIYWFAPHNPESISRHAIAYYANTLAFAVAVWLQWNLNLPFQTKPQNRSLLAEIKEGIVYVYRTPKLWFTMLLVGGYSSTIVNFNILIPYFAKQVFHLQEVGFGILNAVFAIGSICGALAQTHQNQPLITLKKASLALLVAALGFAFAPYLWLSGVFLLGCGYFMLSMLVCANSFVQQDLPSHIRGRVMSLYTIVLAGLAPVGAMVMGFAVSNSGWFGPRLGVAVVCFLALLVYGTTFYFWNKALKTGS